MAKPNYSFEKRRKEMEKKRKKEEKKNRKAEAGNSGSGDTEGEGNDAAKADDAAVE